MFTVLNALIAPPLWDPSFVPVITINYQMGARACGITRRIREKTGCFDNVSFCAGPT